VRIDPRAAVLVFDENELIAHPDSVVDWVEGGITSLTGMRGGCEESPTTVTDPAAIAAECTTFSRTAPQTLVLPFARLQASYPATTRLSGALSDGVG
jgi:hypothetical protein